ncbi:MAG TPA: hypothetical protein VMJ93_09175 [Verrucomicrobiae bacterium]|nr:hypothetical protein [Verrucomicrobiae bacterium]
METIWQTQDSYPVEISGWDKAENFFVERTSLEWGQDQKHQVRLRSPLRMGSIVFVRLVQKMIENAAFPIAYQAVHLDQPDEKGFARVKLEQMHPRGAEGFAQESETTEMKIA